MAIAYSSILIGVEPSDVRIEALRLSGFSGIHILGAPPSYTIEARERIKHALDLCGRRTDEQKVLVQITCARPLKLARSDLALLDFPIAAAIALAFDENDHRKSIDSRPLHLSSHAHAIGKLHLSGELESGDDSFARAIAAQLPATRTLCLPVVNLIPGASPLSLPAHRFRSFSEFDAWLRAGCEPIGGSKVVCSVAEKRWSEEFTTRFHASFSVALRSWMREPPLALALVVALAGRHNLLVVGSPGIGKTHALHQIESLLPPLSEAEHSERSLLSFGRAEDPSREDKRRTRPFRSPLHTCSTAGLVGNARLQPGEYSLAHRGVLFLDEFLEFARSRTESLREPLERKRIQLASAHGSVTLPCDFQLLAASNPCACGWFFSPWRGCRCPPRDRRRSLAPFSGPLLDRFHLRLALTGDTPCQGPSRALAAGASGPDELQDFLDGNASALAPFLAELSAALVDKEAMAALADGILASLWAAYFNKEDNGCAASEAEDLSRAVPRALHLVEAREPFSHPFSLARSLKEQTNDATALANLLGNERARAQSESLLRTLEKVFPNVATPQETAASLRALCTLRGLDRLLEILMTMEGNTGRRPVPTFASSRSAFAR